MKTYIVLRGNQEFGPYLIKEIEDYGLYPSDLVWVEGESRSWQHPDEVNELQSASKKKINKAFPQVETSTTAGAPLLSNSLELNTNIALDNDLISAAFHFAKGRGACSAAGQSRIIAGNFFGLVVLIIGLSLAAFVLQKMVAGFSYDNSSTADAREITAEILATGSSAHTGKTIDAVSQPAVSVPADISPTDLLPTVPAAKKLPVKTLITSTKSKENVAVNTSLTSNFDKENAETIIAEESKQEPVAAVVRASSLQLSANDYKVGLFGGISNLEISISNPSPLPVEKATIEIEFLKPNGNIAKSQTILVENIPSGSSKKVTVPSSNRGVKVRYRVVSTDATTGKLAVSDT